MLQPDHPVKTLLSLGSNLKGLWYRESPSTKYDGSDSVLETWESVDASTHEAALHSTVFNGADPRPEIRDEGIYFNSQAGFTVSNGLLSNTDEFALYLAFDLGVSGVTEYANKATADAAVSSKVEGDIARVTSDTTTSYSPDFSLVFDTLYFDSNLVNGYYTHNNGSWGNFEQNQILAFTGAGSEYIKIYLNRLGQIFCTVYAGSGSPYTVQSTSTNLFLTSGPQLLAIRMKDDILSMWLNGNEMCSLDVSGLSNITTFNTVYMNGDGRSSTPSTCVNGGRHTVKAFCVLQNQDFEEFRYAYDQIALYSQTPLLEVPQFAYGLLTAGQSHWQGALNISDIWTTTSGWDGQVDEINSTNSGENNSITREFIPRVRVARDQNNNHDIGPPHIRMDSFGNVENFNSHKTGDLETIEWGCFKHIIEHISSPIADWTISSAGAGGAALSALSEETSPTPLVQALKGKASAEITYYEELLQSVVYARDYHKARGQLYSAEAFIWQQGHSDLTNANYVSDFLAYYDKLNAAVKEITGQSNDLICVMPQINYSSDGTANAANQSQYIDQKILDIIDGRGARPIYCTGPVYQISSFIHSYTAGYRWVGELFGKVLKRILFDGIDWQPLRPLTFTLGANFVDIDFHVPVGNLQFVDTNDNNIDARVNVGGVDTYGFEFEDTSAGGVVITSVTIQDADTVRINLSGAPVAGDVVRYTGDDSRFGNLCDQDTEAAYYKDQDWTVALSSGSPTYKEGNLNDLRNWCVAFREVLA